DARIQKKIAGMASDVSPEVQLQVAIAARKMPLIDALPVLLRVLESCGHDKLIPSIVWPNLHPLLARQSAAFVRLLEQSKPTPGCLSAQLLAARFGIAQGGVELVRQQLLSPALSEETRLGSLRVLIAFRDATLPEALSSLLSKGSNQFLTKVLAALGGSDNPK